MIAGGSQIGVYVVNGGVIRGGAGGTVDVTGTGGAGGSLVNRGVTVYAANSKITSSGASIKVTGTAGSAGTFYGIGVSLLFAGNIVGPGNVEVIGTGRGAGVITRASRWAGMAAAFHRPVEISA